MNKVWSHTEYGHDLFVVKLDQPDSKGRGFRLYDNGAPAIGGQWHYSLDNAIARAKYVVKISYVQRIVYLEQRVQVLEAEEYIIGKKEAKS